MKKLFVIAILIISLLCLSLVSCNQNTKEVTTTEIYNLYKANAESVGEIPLSYEEWLNSIKGEKGDTGIQGEKGDKGDTGENGISIVSIEKTNTDEQKDTYTITFSNGETSVFYIERGTAGEKGDKGDTGLSAYELYKKYHPEYIKTEQEFIEDLLAKTPLENKNPQGLDFYLKSDNTYAVGIGNASQLNEITIPSSYDGKAVTEIVDSGFSNSNQGGITSICYTKIVLPNTITKIGNKAFYGATNLTTINIPDSVVKIGDNAFYNCSSLSTITFGEGLTTIGVRAFENCYRLTTISFGVNITTLSRWSFFNCKNLTTINFAGTVPQWTYNVKKEVTWDNYTGAYVVTCSNGQIEK